MAAAAAGAAITIGAQALVTGRDPFASRPARLEQTVTSRLNFPVWDMTFSPDGQELAVGGMGSTSVYDLAAGRRIAVLSARQAEITSVAFSPDGRTLTATSDGGTDVQMWDMAARRLEPGLRQPRNYGFYSASYSRDGRFLAASDSDGTGTYVWDVATRRPAAILAFSDAGLSPVAFSPDGRTLAIADGVAAGQGRRFGNIYLWNSGTRTVTGRLHDPGGQQIIAIAWSPGGTLLAATDARRIYLWNIAARKLLRIITPAGQAILRDVEYSPAGRWLAAPVADGGVLIWDTRTGRLAATLPSPDDSQASALAYSPDGRSLAVGEYDGHVYLWNASQLP